jgi:putative endonuclease
MKSIFVVYILKSLKDNRYYIGQTSSLDARLNAHNRGSVRSTKNRRPLKLVWFKEFNSRAEAMKEEARLKRYKDTEKFLVHRSLHGPIV